MMMSLAVAVSPDVTIGKFHNIRVQKDYAIRNKRITNNQRLVGQEKLLN